MRYRPLLDRFWDKFERPGVGCWEWKAGVDGGGYGKLCREHDRHLYKAHRLAYMLWYGPIPDGLNVCHHCDNPICVRPEHLFLGTQKDNVHDCANKGRHRHGRVDGSHNPRTHLSDTDIGTIRALYDTCRYTQLDLAKQFEIARSTVGHIVTGYTWKEVCQQ